MRIDRMRQLLSSYAGYLEAHMEVIDVGFAGIRLFVLDVSDLSLEGAHSDSYPEPLRYAKLHSYRQVGDQKRLLGADLLLYSGLVRLYDIKDGPGLCRVADAHGKPHIADREDIHFNISHSGGYCVCAFASAPVGVDVQTAREFGDTMARRVMTAAEYDRYAATDDAMRCFFELWTLKEAAAKAMGLGLGADFSRISFAPGDGGRLAVVHDCDPYKYEAEVLGLQYPAFFSVCARKNNNCGLQFVTSHV